MLILGSTSSWLVPNAMGPPRLSEGMPPQLGAGDPRCPPPPPNHILWYSYICLWVVFCPLLKISLVNPNLKIFDLAKLFVAETPI